MYLNLKNRILSITLLIVTCLLFIQHLSPNLPAPKVSPRKPNMVLYQVEAKKIDPRTQILTDYFAKYKSPLAPHAQDFIDAADHYDVDWKLVPSIAGVESTFGKHIPYGTYNGWGWGVYGNQALGFKSWRDGIFTVTGGLKKNYINKGLTTPYAMNKIYAASPAWGWKVSFFMNDLEKFARDYPEPAKIEKNQPKSSHDSAKLAYK